MSWHLVLKIELVCESFRQAESLCSRLGPLRALLAWCPLAAKAERVVKDKDRCCKTKAKNRGLRKLSRDSYHPYKSHAGFSLSQGSWKLTWGQEPSRRVDAAATNSTEGFLRSRPTAAKSYPRLGPASAVGTPERAKLAIGS
jgi:hypothetical protein